MDKNYHLNYRSKYDDKFINSYLEENHCLHPNGRPDDHTFDVLMAFDKIIYGLESKLQKSSLPFSYKGLKILNVCGEDDMSSVTQGGRYDGMYQNFEIHPSNKLGKLGVGTNFNWGSENEFTKGAQVCLVSSVKETHSLQLSLISENCTLDDSKKYWNITHDGSRGGKNQNISKMISTIRKFNANHLIHKTDDGKERVTLGKLHYTEDCTWENSKELIANILHYGMIRYFVKTQT